jgi:hypothetical protein
LSEGFIGVGEGQQKVYVVAGLLGGLGIEVVLDDALHQAMDLECLVPVVDLDQRIAAQLSRGLGQQDRILQTLTQIGFQDVSAVLEQVAGDGFGAEVGAALE